LALQSATYAAEELWDDSREFAQQEDTAKENSLDLTLEEVEGARFFRSPSANRMIAPDDNYDKDYGYDYYNFEDTGNSYGKLKEGEMPMFKQVRVILKNKLRKLHFYDIQEDNSEIYNNDTEQKDDNEQTVKNISWKFWKKSPKQEDVSEENNFTQEENVAEMSVEDESEKPLSLESGVSEHVTQKEFILDSDSVNYDEETGNMIAQGRPILTIPPQKTKVIADTITYNQDSNIMKAYGNVVLIRDGIPTNADYFEVDMNDETMFMDNVSADNSIMIMNAQKGVQEDGVLIFTKGNFHSNQSRVYRFRSTMVGPNIDNMVIRNDKRSLFLTKPEGHNVHFDCETIYVDAGKDFDKFTAKNIKVRHRGRYWFTWPSLTAYTNKERNYLEANYPEFGTKTKLGMYVGPGFVFGTPNGAVVKVIPFLNYQKSKFGFGGALKYRSKFNSTELGYGTSANIFFLRGMQRLDNNLFLQYGSNTYMDEWFIGRRMPKYTAEIFYDKKYGVPNFLAEGRGLTFRHRLGFGIMEDSDTNRYGERFRNPGHTTTRLRYMAQVSQKLFSYEKPENDFYFDASVVMQGSAAVYGTGDTQFIGRIGPRAHIQYKNWMQNIGYYQTAYDDNSPMARYDSYRYGHSSLYLTEVLRICKYITVGWNIHVNLSNDSPSGKLLQENRFVIAVGPDDLKIRFGYDVVRQNTYVGFDVAFDTQKARVNYERMEIKNPERLGKTDEQKISFEPAAKQAERELKEFSLKMHPKKTKTAVLQYAKVINIEDPDRETVD